MERTASGEGNNERVGVEEEGKNVAEKPQEPYAYLSPSIPTGDGDEMRPDECVKSWLQRKLVGEFFESASMEMCI
ncbi:hypothetical protein Y032_0723g1840 [Ancylostoma ceylanicum]|uniref:Uncharacterized protein n=1 Tax=Ancylostoma ceylanicum TaxID=53326 RepID=A0A016WFD0_9BILA|nr:hypothetical protein Y032_0723g1840 [Ancylostoma ceylanicum]